MVQATSSQLLCVNQKCINAVPLFNQKMAVAVGMDKPKQKKNPVIKIKSSMKLLTTPRLLILVLPLVIIFIVLILTRRYPFPDDSISPFAVDKGLHISDDSENYIVHPIEAEKDILLGRGFLATTFEEGSCLSRFQSSSYHKPSFIKSSSYLLPKLRNYEDLHRRCGPHTKSYNITVNLLRTGQTLGQTDCNYLVWASFGSIQNKLLSLASAFLYVLLTNRVLLVDRGKGISDISDLLCEPFPNMSWLLPLDFPFGDKLNNLGRNSYHSYGYLVKNNLLGYSEGQLPGFIYLHLVHDYDDHDKLFFCDQDQTVLQKFPWLIMKTDNYFVPSLFLIPSFEQELNRLFPQREYVFHYLGRYLFHPSNGVWNLITKYHRTFLANADEKVGIQIEIFDPISQPFSYVMNQISAWTLNEKILPRVTKKQSESEYDDLEPQNTKSIAVLVSSSNSGYYEKLKSIYENSPTINGTVSIYQINDNFEEEDEEIITENMKIWAEMFLLSLTDVLITSSKSTLGYVAQGLRGWTDPWILLNHENEKEVNGGQRPAELYRMALSIEPCFQNPPLIDCNSKNMIYSRSVLDHVRYCEDMIYGIKLVDGLSDDIS